MLVVLRACGFAFRNAWAESRVLTAASLVLLAAVSALPALQVLLVASLVHGLTNGESFETVLPVLAGVAGVAAAGLPLDELLNAVGYQLVGRSRARCQIQLAETIAALPPSEIRTREMSDRIQSVSDSIPMHVGYLYKFVLQALTGVVTAIALCAAVFSFNPIAGILILLAVIPTLVALQYLSAKQEAMDPQMAALRRRADYLTTLLTQQRSAVELSGLGTSPRVARWIGQQHRTLADFESYLLPAELRAQLIGGVVTGLLIAGALAAVVIGSDFGAAAAAGIVGALSGASAMRGAGFSIGEVAESAPKVARFRALIASAPVGQVQRPGERVHSVEIRQLSYQYPGVDRLALQDVSLYAERGEMIALVGPNGAGKTTTVNCLTGVLVSSPGSVIIDGRDATTIPEDERWGYFGVLTQEFGRYEVTVADAVNLGTPDDLDPAALHAALRTARADDLVSSFADGLQTQLGDQWGGVGISGGEWQRIALARIAARDAGVWILDEPTSAVDAAAEQEIFDELSASKADRITIVVSHRAWTLRHVDRIYVFDQGRIVEQGRYDELLAGDGTFARLFKQQTLSA